MLQAQAAHQGHGIGGAEVQGLGGQRGRCHGGGEGFVQSVHLQAVSGRSDRVVDACSLPESTVNVNRQKYTVLLYWLP